MKFSNRGIFTASFGIFSGIFSAWMVAASASANVPQVLNYAMLNEPPNLNTLKSEDTESHMVLGHLFEGLTGVGKNFEPTPGVATHWEMDAKGVTFHLRKNAKWSDGKSVTAKDFVFAWKTALDPAVASTYAWILYPVKNAEAINTGKKPGSALGVVAVDDFTLKVTLERPCGYFVQLTSMPTYGPVREDFYQSRKERYAANHTDMLFNGPFILTKWVHGAELEFAKNPHYWNKDKIKLEKISVPYITPDAVAQFNFFKDKKIDVVSRLNQKDLPRAAAEKFQVRTYSDMSLWYMEFNHRDGRVTRNANIRKAIRAIFSPDGEYVQKVVGIPGTVPGRGLVPVVMRGVKSTFRKEYPIAAPAKPDLAKAKQYLSAAMKELGLSQPPSLTWLTGDTNFAAAEAEYMQGLFKKIGIDLKIDKQIFKQRLAKMQAGDFDIVSAGWGPDYADPMTFAELFTSWNQNNYGKFYSTEYDRLVREAQNSVDPKVRMDAMAKAEKILLDDEGIIPTYERTVAYLVQPWVKGVVRRGIGHDPDFTGATIER